MNMKRPASCSLAGRYFDINSNRKKPMMNQAPRGNAQWIFLI